MKYCGGSVMKLWNTRRLLRLTGILLAPVLWGQSVLTWHNDAGRSGLNSAETILSPSNVNSTNFGLLNTLTLDGTVDAQPLYVQSLSIAAGTHNVLYVATENDTLYALDADNGAQLWSLSVLGSGETASDNRSCSQVSPQIGITSTPAISGRPRQTSRQQHERGSRAAVQ